MRIIFLVSVLFILNGFSKEPIQQGAYYGEIKMKISNYLSYPTQEGSSAGFGYLLKLKKSTIQYIVDTQSKHIKSGLESAKEFAIKNKLNNFAIDNLNHEVIELNDSVVINTSYNVLAFD